ncbi:MAG: DUF1573 domain-containing protein [Planctomycetota bacterium]
MPTIDSRRGSLKGRNLLVCLGLLALALGNKAQASTGMVFEQPVVRLGKVKSAGTVAQTFSFKVFGNHAAEIVEVRPSCGCVKPTLAKRIFAPGEAGSIILEIHATGQEPGPHQYRLSLTVRDPMPRTIVLAVELELFSDVRIKPAQVLVYMNGSRELRQTVTISDERPRPIDVRALTSSSKWIEPKLVGPEAGEKSPGVQQVELAFAKDFPVGKTEGVVVVSTSDPEYPQFEIPVLVIRSGRIRVSPEKLSLSVRSDAKGVKPHTLILRDRENAAIKVARVRTATPGVQIAWPDLPTRLPKLEISVDPQAVPASAMIEGMLFIDIVEPEKLELAVPFAIQFTGR